MTFSLFCLLSHSTLYKLQPKDTTDGLPLVWTLPCLDNLHKLWLCYEHRILDSLVHCQYLYHIIQANICSSRKTLTMMKMQPLLSYGITLTLNCLRPTLPFLYTHLFAEIGIVPKFLPRLISSWSQGTRSESELAYVANMLLNRLKALESLMLHQS